MRSKRINNKRLGRVAPHPIAALLIFASTSIAPADFPDPLTSANTPRQSDFARYPR